MMEVLLGALATLGAALFALWKAYGHQKDAREDAERKVRSTKNQLEREQALRNVEREAADRAQKIPQEVKDEVASGTRGQFTRP